MSHVALGIVEAYWEYRLKPWDMAAGVLVMISELMEYAYIFTLTNVIMYQYAPSIQLCFF